MKTVRVAGLLMISVTAMNSEAMRMVEYDIDGTAKYVDVTWTNGASGTEQKQIKLPFHESFLAPAGTLAYISAQKVRVTRIDPSSFSGLRELLTDGVHGDVHVVIHINQRMASEATADAPFGIAKASAKLE